ncbi:MAG: TonB-dependent receptor, partial [Ectothiorhodospiraceae bacterium]|nr:TonB-dependent receptor [Ectothiorhodospiraceae bacterium]
ELDAALFRSVTPGSVGPFAGQSVPAEPLSASSNDTDMVWRLGAQYYVHDDLNFFATVTRGYKAAGIVSGLTIGPTEPGGTTLPTVDAEKPTQYEVGMRSRAWDGRLTTNLTAFYSIIDDFQAQALVPGPDGTAIFSVTNAGKVRTWGLEGELTLMPTSQLTLSTAFAYTRARYRDFDAAPCYTLQPVGDEECVDTTGDGQGEFQDLSGGRLEQSPDWVVNALARYDQPLAGGNEAFGQVGLSYRSSTYGSNTNDPNTRMSGYSLVDAQLGVDFWEGRGTFTLFARNLFDKDFVEAIVPQSFDTGGYAQFSTFESRRSFGARISLRY